MYLFSEKFEFDLKSGTNCGKAQGMSGKNYPKEVPREIRLSRGAQPRGTVRLPEGPPVGKFSDNS